MSGTLTPLAALESVLCTEELNRRPARRPDYERENRALVSLAQALADSPRTILQAMAEKMLEVFQCDSAGFSLLTHDEKRFVWVAIAGAWQPHQGGGTPRDFGPCGDVLDCNAPLLFRHWERRYPHLLAATPAAEEGLLVPFYVEGKAVGTIWAIAHDERRKFDSEDLRMLVSLGAFASAAYQAVEQMHALSKQDHEHQAALGLREMNEALLVSSVRQHELTEQAEEATAALRVSEAFNRSILENSPDCVKVLDAAGRLMDMNANGLCLMEIDDFATVEGRLWCDLWPQEERAEVLAAIEAARAGGTGKFQSNGLTARGTSKWWDVIVAPIHDVDGEVIRFVSVSRDITERRQSEQALRESQSRLGHAANAASLTYVEVDFARGGARTAENFAAVMGYAPPPEQEADVSAGTRLLLEHVMPHDRPSVEAALQDFLDGKPVGKIEYRVLGDDQIERWIESAWSIEIGPSGKPLKTFATNLDITERKRAEEALRQIERNLRFVMDSMPQKIFTATPDGDLDYFNPQWTEFTGLSFEQMQDSGWTKLVHPDDVEEKMRLWQRAFDTGEPFQSEHRFRRADGEYRWHFSRAVPMRDQAGQITMWVGSNTDVHDLKLVEAKLQKQAAELADQHRRKDEFLAMLSHELRSPLAPIANAVQLLSLQQGSESRIQQQARSIIERQLRQLKHLVDDLLEVSRITTGRVQLRRERVVISNIVNGAVETARPLMEQRRHELTVSLPPEPIWLIADAARLEQVLVNLLNNAAKYTEAGGHVELVVSVEWREKSGEWRVAGGENEVSEHAASTSSSPLTPHHSPLTTPFVVIRVRDNGIGIAPELLPRVFDLFTQAERSLDRSQGGLGIGLALVQRLTELLGGTVEAISTLGQGSEFVVSLPLESDEVRVASGEQDNLGHAPSPLATPHSPLATPLRVLVVDDNVDTVLTFSLLLRASGHDVQTAHDGLAAVQAAIDYTPDVMLLDIGLPGLNGHEVAKRIRQHPTLKHVVLVALTGYGQDSDRQISQQAGFNHHLVKPARLDQVQNILATVVEQRASRKSSNS